MNSKKLLIEIWINIKKIFHNIWDNIHDLIFYNPVSIWFRHCIRFFKRLPKYLKLSWNNENWDYEYLYDLIEMKLKEFQEAQEKDILHRGTKERAEQIKTCLELMDKFRNPYSYIDYPFDDCFDILDDGTLEWKKRSKKEEKERQKRIKEIHKFEEDNFNKFWDKFKEWHRGWWV